MERELVMGNEAIGRGLIEAGCQVMCAYPGTPSSEILPSVVRYKRKEGLNTYVEWSVNEKVAFEVALAAAMAGKRSAVAMKQVGLNVASDPLMSSAYTGVDGGFVVISCDDPGPESSQTEQDTRMMAMLAKVPVLDPSNIYEAKEFAKLAFEVSERYQVPVILRPTTKVCYLRGEIELGPVARMERGVNFQRDPRRWAATPKFRYLLHKRLNEKLKAMEQDFSENKLLNFVTIDGGGNGLGIIAEGVAFCVAQDILKDYGLEGVVPILKIGTSHPLPRELVGRFIEGLETVVVLEETMPIIEMQIPDRRKVLGRFTGTIPPEGEITADIAASALLPLFKKFGLIEEVSLPEPSIQEALKEMELPPRPPRLCPGCPHTASFYAIRSAFPNAIFPSDIGCYTLGLNMGAVDTCLVMGAGVSIATGLYHSYKQDGKGIPPIVATIGDSTFFHAGVPPLINAVHTNARFILVVLDNDVIAMTGQQPPPHSNLLADGSTGQRVSIKELVAATGVKFIKELDPYDIALMVRTLREAYQHTIKEDGGVAVVIAKRPCALYQPEAVRVRLQEYKVTAHCTGCRVCLEVIDCPALVLNAQGKVDIDPKTCVRCGLCVYVCPENGLGAQAFDFPPNYISDSAPSLFETIGIDIGQQD